MSDIFRFIPHPRIAARKETGPPKVADVIVPAPDAPWIDRFNAALAVKITNAVGSMWCAYAFTLLALASLPAVLSGFHVFAHTFPTWLIKTSIIALVSWVAQTFLQLVLLSIIIVGQNVQAAASDKRAEATYEDADAVLHTALEIQHHLEAQDTAIGKILARLDTLGGGPAPAPAS